MSEHANGEVPLEWQGRRFTLVLDWAAIAWFERTADTSMVDFYAALALGRPRLSHLAWFLMAMLQRHHAAVTLDEAGAMAMDDGVRRQLDLAAGAAMPSASAGEVGNAPGAPANP